MTPDGFLTFLALLVAVYAVASPVAKLRVRLEVKRLQIILAVFAAGAALYFMFFDALKRPCPRALGKACEWLTLPINSSFTSQDAAFLVVLAWMLSAWVLHSISKVGPSSLQYLSKLVDELLVEERYAELFKLIEPHLPMIDQASRRDLRLQRLHDRMAALVGKGSHEYFLKMLDDEGKHGQRRMWPGTLRSIGHLHFLVPSQRKEEKHASDILRSIYRADEARRFIVKQRPYAAIPLLRLDRYERSDFSDRLFRDLIADTGSALYLEIREQPITRYQVQELLAHNRLLHFLFSDAENATKLGVWKPVGDYVLKRLDPAIDTDYVSFLNGPATHFEQEKWNDPTYIAVQFFSLMVNAAAHQSVRWHMWLHYLPPILKKLEENYDTSSQLVDTTAEFPTRAARLIYEIVDALGDIVKVAQDLPEQSPHSRFPDKFKLDNGNIPLSAAIALGQCVETIAKSRRLGETFATHMYECALRDISQLPSGEKSGKLRSLLIESVIRGGHTLGGYSSNDVYGERLAALLEQVDYHLQADVSDYILALDRAFPDALPQHIKP